MAGSGKNWRCVRGRLFRWELDLLSHHPSLPPPKGSRGHGFDLQQESPRLDTGWPFLTERVELSGGNGACELSIGMEMVQAWRVMGLGRDRAGAVTEAKRTPTNTHTHNSGITGFHSQRCFPLAQEFLLNHGSTNPCGASISHWFISITLHVVDNIASFPLSMASW